MFVIETPVSCEEIRDMKVGETFYLSGTIFTARDMAHKKLKEFIDSGRKVPFDLSGGVIYHCGPVLKKLEDGGWMVIAAGPTTSLRMERYGWYVIKNLGVKIVVGKGGMGEETKRACEKYCAIYATYPGGAALKAAKCIKKVESVYWLDLGIVEAVWKFRVDKFGPLTIVIDTKGNDLMKSVRKNSEMRRRELLKNIFNEG
ncbi:MAG: FumA C-terminus/TtdB family hydratase beta subunit [Candidatus Asgardarchaeia archaeon]